jgi:hypothetical protein
MPNETDLWIAESARLHTELKARGEHMPADERLDHEMAIRNCRRMALKSLEKLNGRE